MKAEISAYYALNMNEYSMEFHAHNRYEIMYMVRGECTIHLENEIKVLKQGHIILLYPNIVHKLQITNQTNCSLLNVEWRMGDGNIDLTHACQKSEKIARFCTDTFKYKIMYDRGGFEFATKDLINTLENNSDDTYLLEILFSRFLLEMLRAEKTSSYYSSVQYINKAKQYIEENLSFELSVEDIAKHVGISGYYLQSLFSKYLDSGIINYVNDMRIAKACFLLVNSNLSIYDIAFEVGFNSRQHFAYTFEKRKKMSPLNYKKISGQTLKADTKTFKQV